MKPPILHHPHTQSRHLQQFMCCFQKTLSTIFAHMSPTAALLTRRFLKSFLSLSLGGVVIGLLHQYDIALAVLLVAVTILYFLHTVRLAETQLRARIILAGGVITMLLGVIGEWWGISNGYWMYHDLAEGREFAAWLPMAWMLAFFYLYRIEESIIYHLKITSFKRKLVLTMIISAILPTWGEVVAINLGVWTYTWDYQLLGVPLLAIFLLMVLHSGIFLLLTIVCRRYKIENLVFGLPPHFSQKKEGKL